MVTCCWDIPGSDYPSNVPLFHFSALSASGRNRAVFAMFLISSTNHLLKFMSTVIHFLWTLFSKSVDRYSLRMCKWMLMDEWMILYSWGQVQSDLALNVRRNKKSGHFRPGRLRRPALRKQDTSDSLNYSASNESQSKEKILLYPKTNHLYVFFFLIVVKYTHIELMILASVQFRGTKYIHTVVQPPPFTSKTLFILQS